MRPTYTSTPHIGPRLLYSFATVVLAALAVLSAWSTPVNAVASLLTEVPVAG